MDDETWQSGPKKHKTTIFKPLELEAQLSSKFVVIPAPLSLDFVQFASAGFILSVQTCVASPGVKGHKWGLVCPLRGWIPPSLSACVLQGIFSLHSNSSEDIVRYNYDIFKNYIN